MDADLDTLLAREFPQSEDLVYLNHAGVSPWPRRAAEAVTRFAEENVTNGALHYPQWVKTETRLRSQLQTLIHADSPQDIALLKSTSEGLSFVAQGLDWRPGDSIVTSDEEFPSNRVVWEALGPRGVTLRQVHLEQPDRTPEEALIEACDDTTRLLAISSVEYASGLRIDLPVLGRFCHDAGILFCVDGIQSIGAMPVNVHEIGADFLCADGHKWMMGPEGIALFYVRPELRETLQLTEYGWHMVEDMGNYDREDWSPALSARRFECGSPNMLGVYGLSASLSLLLEAGEQTVSRLLLKKASFLIESIKNIPDFELVTNDQPGRYAGLVTFRHRRRENREWFQDLRSAGIVCAQRGDGVRFSPHFYTPDAKLERALERAL